MLFIISINKSTTYNTQGNLQPNTDLATKMPNLLSLKNAIYSKSYLQIIERLTNLPPNTLTNTTIDCAINCHTKGCHLLCHDDVIGTRKISFIIYLTDVGWSRDDGGCLELYDAVREEDDDNNDNNEEKKQSSTSTSHRHVPTALPTKTILPNFNTMAYFVVKPGVSFHSVQEVFNTDKPRLSIQGWYHAKEQPDDIENATLQRLKSSGMDEDTEGEFEPLPPVVEKGKEEASSEAAAVSTLESEISSTTPTPHNLSEKDINFLSQYMNKAYLSSQSMNEIQKRFENESSVQLRHFLLDEWNTKITSAMNDEDTRDKLGNDRPSLDYRLVLLISGRLLVLLISSDFCSMMTTNQKKILPPLPSIVQTRVNIYIIYVTHYSNQQHLVNG